MCASANCTPPTRRWHSTPAPMPFLRSTVTDMALLRCNHLVMRFGGLVAIADLNLEVAEQSIHSVIGPNGAGKTTVFNCITQNLKPSSGEVWFAGQRVD